MIKLHISKSDIDRLTDQVVIEWEEKVLNRMSAVCDMAIEKQWLRFRPEGYNDDTGQLRSATGYIIYHNGKVVRQRFELSKYGTDKSPGLKAGKDYAFGMLRETSGWGIIFVAGMEYASYVQGKGFSVLQHAEIILEKDLLKELDSIKA